MLFLLSLIELSQFNQKNFVLFLFFDPLVMTWLPVVTSAANRAHRCHHDSLIFFSVTSFWQKYSLGLKMSLLVLAQERFIAWKIWVQSHQPFFNQEWKKAHFTLTEKFGFIFGSLMMLKVFGMLCFFGLRVRRVPRWEWSGLGTKAQKTVVTGAPISWNIFFCIFVATFGVSYGAFVQPSALLLCRFW